MQDLVRGRSAHCALGRDARRRTTPWRGGLGNAQARTLQAVSTQQTRPRGALRQRQQQGRAVVSACLSAAEGDRIAARLNSAQPRASLVSPPARSPAWCSAARLLSACQAHPMASIRTTPSPSPRPPEPRHWRTVAFECARRAELTQWGTPVPRHPRANWKGDRITQRQQDLPVARITAARPADTLASNTAGAGSRSPQF